MPLRALARVNLAAIERNVARLNGELVGGAGLCAVVKADGYGHGAVPAAHAALAGAPRAWPWPRQTKRPSCARRA